MDRRRALVVFVNTVIAGLGAGLSTLLGAFALRPPSQAGASWVRAAALSDLAAGTPVPRAVVFPRRDAWFRARVRETVFLVRDDAGVHALSATCTHLGCRVRWDVGDSTFRCPCHGGVFDAEGRVVSGPPPRPLDRLDVRIDTATGEVLVRL